METSDVYLAGNLHDTSIPDIILQSKYGSVMSTNIVSVVSLLHDTAFCRLSYCMI